MERSQFIFDLVQLMHYKRHRVNIRRGAPYIDSPDRMKKKKATINPKHKDNKCIQYVVMVALNYEEIQSYPERVSSIKPFINKCNQKR